MAKAAPSREREAAAPGGVPPTPAEIEAQTDLAAFHDIPITVGVQMDHKMFSLAEILDLKVDSIIKLERSAGENVDLLLNGVIAGNGEIVVIEDTMGLRVTDLGAGAKRIAAK